MQKFLKSLTLIAATFNAVELNAENSFNSLIQGAFNLTFPILVSSFRTVADFEFDDVNLDFEGQSFALNGISITPLDSKYGGRPCTVEIDRISVSGSNFWESLVEQKGAIELSGVSIPRACFWETPEIYDFYDVLEAEYILIQRAFINFEHLLPDASMNISLFAQSENLISFGLELHAPYVTLAEIDPTWFDDPMPAMEVESVEFEFQNLGLWETLAGHLPERLFVPRLAGIMAQAAVEEFLVNWNSTGIGNGLNAELSVVQKAFAFEVRDEVERFVRQKDGLRLAFEARGESLAFSQFSENPLADGRQFFSLVDVSISDWKRSTPSSPEKNLLKSYFDGEDLSDADTLLLGRALMEGSGVPRSTLRGAELLKLSAQEGNAEAAILAAQALKHSNPEEAYNLALLASCVGSNRAGGLLDDLERRIGFKAAFESQTAAMKDYPRATLAPGFREAADLAYSHLRGNGACRSYASAWFFASLCAASGEIQCEAIQSELSARMTANEDRATYWLDLEQRESELALEYWFYVGMDN